MMKPDTMRGLLALAILAFVGVLLFMIVEINLAAAMRDIAMVIVGGVLTKFSAVYDYYFGSSDGSKAKTELLKERPTGRPNDPVHVEEEPPLDLSGSELDR